jgi:hypothetical protein
MTCDWMNKWIEFKYMGAMIRLQGMLPSSHQQQLQEVFVEQVLKWDRRNNLWATVLLTPSVSEPSMTKTYL